MSFLAEPTNDERVSLKALGYVSEATRDAMYDLVVRKFMESGISQVTLAKRLGKNPAQVCRTLGASGNWTIDTVAELLFAIDGSLLKISSHQPLRAKTANKNWSHCLSHYQDQYVPKTLVSRSARQVLNTDQVIMPEFEGA